MDSFVYVLRDPDTERVRYVGRSIYPFSRYKSHLRIRTNDNTYRANWIRSLATAGKKPVIEIIQSCPDDKIYSVEQFWIAYYRACGSPLTNGSDGGSGLLNPTADVRAKMSSAGRARKATFLGKHHSEEARLKMSAAKKGRETSDETRERNKIASIELWKNPEFRLKMSLARSGKSKAMHEEARLNHSIAAKKCWAERKSKNND
jgi:hypothetical protein